MNAIFDWSKLEQHWDHEHNGSARADLGLLLDLFLHNVLKIGMVFGLQFIILQNYSCLHASVWWPIFDSILLLPLNVINIVDRDIIVISLWTQLCVQCTWMYLLIKWRFINTMEIVKMCTGCELGWSADQILSVMFEDLNNLAIFIFLWTDIYIYLGCVRKRNYEKYIFAP